MKKILIAMLISSLSVITAPTAQSAPAKAKAPLCNGKKDSKTAKIVKIKDKNNSAYVVKGTKKNDVIIVNINVFNKFAAIQVDGGAGNDSICIIGKHKKEWIVKNKGNQCLADGEITIGGTPLRKSERMETLLIGGVGDDYINAGAWGSAIIGGQGSDTLIGSKNFYNAILGGGDMQMFGDGNIDNSIDTIYGGSKCDYLVGDGEGYFFFGDMQAGSGNDIIYGYGGNDAIYGSGGSDTIYGGSGNDAISGGRDADTLNGEAGVDRFLTTEGDVITDFTEGEEQSPETFD